MDRHEGLPIRPEPFALRPLPERRRIVFVLAGDVYVMTADGTGERRLTHNKAFDDAVTR